jgi:hypothetical protein
MFLNVIGQLVCVSDWAEVVAYGPLYEFQLSCRRVSHAVGH